MDKPNKAPNYELFLRRSRSSSGHQAQAGTESDVGNGASGSKSKPPQQQLVSAITAEAATEEKVLIVGPKVAKKKSTKLPTKGENPPKPEVKEDDGSKLQSGPVNLALLIKRAKDEALSSSKSQNEPIAGTSTGGSESKESYKEKYGLVIDPWTGVCRYALITPTTKVKVYTPKPLAQLEEELEKKKEEKERAKRAKTKPKK